MLVRTFFIVMLSDFKFRSKWARALSFARHHDSTDITPSHFPYLHRFLPLTPARSLSFSPLPGEPVVQESPVGDEVKVAREGREQHERVDPGQDRAPLQNLPVLKGKEPAVRSLRGYRCCSVRLPFQAPSVGLHGVRDGGGRTRSPLRYWWGQEEKGRYCWFGIEKGRTSKRGALIKGYNRHIENTKRWGMHEVSSFQQKIVQEGRV